MNDIKVGDKVKIIYKDSGESKIFHEQEGFIKQIEQHPEIDKLWCLVDIKVKNISVWIDEVELIEKKNKVYGIALFMMKGVTKC
jgi:hypothetical protein